MEDSNSMSSVNKDENKSLEIEARSSNEKTRASNEKSSEDTKVDSSSGSKSLLFDKLGWVITILL